MNQSRAFIVCGLGFGDEGKGTVTDFLCRRYGAKLVVRYNGGPQATHNVVAPDGTAHCFEQFGSGMLVPGVWTFLSHKMVVSPENLVAEGLILKKKGICRPFGSIVFDPTCPVVTPLQQMVGQMAEIARGSGRHGSCGKGVGQTVLDSESGLGLTLDDLYKSVDLDRKLRDLTLAKRAEAYDLLRGCDTPPMRTCRRFFDDKIDVAQLRRNYTRFVEWFPSAVSGTDLLFRVVGRGETVVFEGTQGALLDRYRGFTPYVTQSRTTAQDAQNLISTMSKQATAEKIGVLRAYGHRHGPGPFISEDTRLAPRFGDALNPENRWQGAFRVGWLDMPALRYGVSLNGGVQALAVTSLDRLSGLPMIRVCVAYEYEGDCDRLNPWFCWTPLGRNHARIDDFRPSTAGVPPSGFLTEILAHCRPVWRNGPGWKEDISGCRDAGQLPAAAINLLKFLSTFLEAPVRIVSVGPRADQKFFIE